ncbi:MAG: hypothetical protein ASARMPRED_008531 [Alectoria sarmentosa]|nr:MAG: hypothetical protein ASARMPRED_008531 [Alectoria sarmentosa]
MLAKSSLSQPFDIQWRKTLVSLARAVLLQFLHITSEGTHPFILSRPSRAKRTIPIYIFVPEKLDKSKARNLPVVIDLHDEGFVYGSCLEQNPLCVKLARELGCVAASMGYRMGTSSEHPAALEDIEDV